jgi:hypothetical protein
MAHGERTPAADGRRNVQRDAERLQLGHFAPTRVGRVVHDLDRDFAVARGLDQREHVP